MTLSQKSVAAFRRLERVRMCAGYITTSALAEAQRAPVARSATLGRRPVPWSVGSVGGTRMAARVFAMTLLFLVASVAVARDEATCKKLDEGANQSGDRIPGYQAIRKVIEKGRLQFFSAPDRGCRMPGVFVVPKDTLIAYVEYKGYTAVMYTDGRNGEQPMGWVLSSRLRATGTGISPKQ